MTVEEWANAVQYFHSSGLDTPERAVFLDNNPNVAMICAAWPNCERTVDPEKVQIQSARNWVALWTGIKYDVRGFQEVCGVASHEFRQAFLISQVNRLIFPDGTLSQWADAKLKQMVVGKQSRAPKQKATV